MANPQPENGFVKLANDIWNELIRRNFTKRQKDILLFIWRLSYGCNLKDAFIPRLKDFETCGVPATHIKKELLFLENSQVIAWDKDEKLFAIRKNYDLWQISPVMGWDSERFNFLIHQNLKRKTSQNVNFSEDHSESTIQEDNSETSQNVKSDFTKHEDLEAENFTKREVKSGSIPCGSKAEGVSKDMFKDNFKDNSCCYTPPGESKPEDEGIPTSRQGSVPATPETGADSIQDQISSSDIDYRMAMADKYLRRRGKGLEITVADDQVIDELIKEGVPLQTALDGIDQAFDNFKPKHKWDEIRTVRYCATVIYSLHASRQAADQSAVTAESIQESDSAPQPDEQYNTEDLQKMLAELRAKQGG
ncbi:replication protein [Paenibacillus medicaginis]|uniref:Replication protein n=1 Tax=Paenibacillus medicaginis TaxID=1470560 RepID=A0ABV5C0U7_9BACL